MTVDGLRKCATAVYLATEGSVAEDIAKHLLDAANRITELEAKLEAAQKNARTPGTVEICPKCECQNSLEDYGLLWDCCPHEPCPIHTASSPQAGEGNNG